MKSNKDRRTEPCAFQEASRLLSHLLPTGSPGFGRPETVGLLLPGRLRPREGHHSAADHSVSWESTQPGTRTQVLLRTLISPESNHQKKKKKAPLETKSRRPEGQTGAYPICMVA